MGLKECQITLDNPWNTYYPGQTINGRVEYTFDSPKKVRGIYIKFRGESETSWSTTGTRKDADGKTTNTTIPYHGTEEYFNISYYMLGSKSGNEIEIPPGKHTYPFTCALPPTLASSFEGEFGFVRYTIKVTLDRPWKFDQETKMAFTVVSHLDLNLSPEYRAPIQIHLEKSFCCCWCKSGPLMLDVGLPVSGYCSGQVIPLDISCENGSNVSISEIHIMLRKVVKFRSQTPNTETKESKIIIAEIKLGAVNANASKNWKETMEIPPLPPSNLTNCGLIDLDYEVKVICSPSGMHMNIDDKKIITLGTVPIVGFQSPPPGAMPEGGQPQPMPAANAPLLPSGPMPDNPNSNMQPAMYPGMQPAMQPGMQPAMQPGMQPAMQPGMQPAMQPGMQPAMQPGMQPAMYPGMNPAMNPAMSPGMPPAMPPTGGTTLYPTLAQPSFQEGQFAARSIHDANDNQNMMIHGRADFAPRYPTYGSVQQN